MLVGIGKKVVFEVKSQGATGISLPAPRMIELVAARESAKTLGKDNVMNRCRMNSGEVNLFLTRGVGDGVKPYSCVLESSFLG